VHVDLAAIAAHHAHHVRGPAARRHEVDQRDGAAVGLEGGFENERVLAIAARDLRTAAGRDLPVPVVHRA
jgi:hypothetical protein